MQVAKLPWKFQDSFWFCLLQFQTITFNFLGKELQIGDKLQIQWLLYTQAE